MKSLLLVLLLTGCSTLGGDASNEVALKLLGNLEHCDRAYTVALGMGAAGSLTISCRAKPF